MLAFRISLALLLTLTLATPSAQAQTYTVLYQFKGAADGQGVPQRLALDSLGNIYGTSFGGSNGNGSVFKLDTSDDLTVLYSFSGGADGGIPYFDAGAEVIHSGGVLYGHTAYGGDLSCNGFGVGLGCGVVFKVLTRQVGKETVIHTFHDSANDGYSSVKLLLQKGSLYGTTLGGGTNDFGTVFELTPSHGIWTESLLYSFEGGTDGANAAGLERDVASGNLYGVTRDGGGAGSCWAGPNWGTIFQLDASGHETVLHRFSGGYDGGYCDLGYPNLIKSGSNLYGTTSFGGDLTSCPNGGCGYVFKFDLRTGKLAHLHDFTAAEGGTPYGVVRDAAGNLYGATGSQGSATPGFVFKLDKKGNFIELHPSGNGADSGGPGPVVLDSKGNLYGVTEGDGQFGYGTIYKITP